MYINFVQIRVRSSVEKCAHKFIFKNRKLHKFATTYSNLKKRIISDMRQRINSMCINALLLTQIVVKNFHS